MAEITQEVDMSFAISVPAYTAGVSKSLALSTTSASVAISTEVKSIMVECATAFHYAFGTGSATAIRYAGGTTGGPRIPADRLVVLHIPTGCNTFAAIVEAGTDTLHLTHIFASEF